MRRERDVMGTRLLLCDCLGSQSIDADAIGYIQLCDSPLIATYPSYMEEALHERLVPGTGELPLKKLLTLIPDNVIVSVEVPQRSLAETGLTPRERISLSVQATQRLLEERCL